MSEQPPPPPPPPGQQPGPPGPPPAWTPPPPLPPPPGWTPGPPGPPPTPPRRTAAVAVVVVLALLGSAAIVAGAIVVPRLLRDDAVVGGGPGETGTRTGTRIEGLEVYDSAELVPDHTTDDVDYPQSPPVGGPHDPAWLACGAYDVPVRDENAVHDLEHGSVWITYDPDLDGDDVAALAGLLPDNGIMSPYPDLEADTGSSVVLTVWGRQLPLDDDPLDDPRLQQFLDQFGAGEAALEPFVGCQGGVPDPGGLGNGSDDNDNGNGNAGSNA